VDRAFSLVSCDLGGGGGRYFLVLDFPAYPTLMKAQIIIYRPLFNRFFGRGGDKAKAAFITSNTRH